MHSALNISLARPIKMCIYAHEPSTVTERPPSNFERPLQPTKQIIRVQWQTTRLPATRTSCYTHHCSQPNEEWVDHAVFLLIFGNRLQVVDGRAQSKFCRLTDARFLLRHWEVFVRRWWVKHYSFGVWVLDIRFITPQISPGCPGNVIYIILHHHINVKKLVLVIQTGLHGFRGTVYSIMN